MMNAQNEPMTFEQAMNRLEAIVRILEAGERAPR
jgi:exonuclease VII small subunit